MSRFWVSPSCYCVCLLCKDFSGFYRVNGMKRSRNKSYISVCIDLNSCTQTRYNIKMITLSLNTVFCRFQFYCQVTHCYNRHVHIITTLLPANKDRIIMLTCVGWRTGYTWTRTHYKELNMCFCVVLCVGFCTGHFVMVPLNLTNLHCWQHHEHLFYLYYIYSSCIVYKLMKHSELIKNNWHWNMQHTKDLKTVRLNWQVKKFKRQ